ANIVYIGLSLVHVGIGVLASFLLIWLCLRGFQRGNLVTALGWLLVILGAVAGTVLIFIGATHPHVAWLYAHIAFSASGALLLLWQWISAKNWLGISPGGAAARGLALLLLVAGLIAGSYYTRVVRWHNANRIGNPSIAPGDMAAEGDGPNGHFFPSSAQTRDGKLIPAKYFMESESCKRCHSDIYQQWNSSAHHRSSFNNQWYRKSIEYMQDVTGPKPSKWCGGCHDPALLYSGMMDTPIKQIVNRPEAHAGLGCLMCHSIVQVKSTMGQADFFLEYPRLHALASSNNVIVRLLHDFSVYVNPEPHRRAFLKPFMREQAADFCSTCHKVHLDIPVNHYRWQRGFNDYDNWQASGISGMGARSFYYPAKPQVCVDCHMPLVKSADAGNLDGAVHSHRFPGANTALPYSYEDAGQMDAVQQFLKNNIVSVDIFAVAPEAQKTHATGAENNTGDLSTTFAVGEEADLSSSVPNVANGGPAMPSLISAPLDRVLPALRRGDTERVDVVVRTRKVGHFFPGGTVDAFDVWVELKATDEDGKLLFWSGKVEDDGKGPVEKGAHFYRSFSIDAHGNHINKRNAWASRALLYVRLIPPGAADTVHYRIHIPENAGSKIKFEAKLNYRKFSWFNTQFSYAGIPDPKGPQAVDIDYDDRNWNFIADPSKISGKIKTIPAPPIVTLAQSAITLPITDRKTPQAAPKIELNPADWERWNDYGIGLLLQGDLKAAETAFYKVAELDPKRADGYVNVARALIQEGEMQEAKAVLEKALALQPELARTHYFYARVLRSEGNYDQAIHHLQLVVAQYPKDRVVRNDLGRLYFLKRNYNDAVTEFDKVLSIDPEDLQANYNLMLCYSGLGQAERAGEYQQRYLRFKADEAAQALTGSYRIKHPEDNNERQAIHEHESIPLVPSSGKSIAMKKRVQSAGRGMP
ncbi:MAG TPA: tetratricopeptide repeat protein, partial [Terriglobales bacterium]